MLSIGFGELLIIATIGLIVIGPQRLPATARFLGHLWGRVQRQVSGIRSEIRREMALEDMKKIHQEYVETKSTVEDSLSESARKIYESAKGVQEIAMDKEALSDSPPLDPPLGKNLKNTDKTSDE